MRLETLNELTLKVHMTHGEILFTKAGAFIGGESFGSKNYQFEKVLLGPQGNPVSAIAGQLVRRFTGENLPLMKVKAQGECLTYYANCEQHVTIVPLNTGERLSVESENLLAFTDTCSYSCRFLAQGVISQKGFATSTLTGNGPNAKVAILTDGNPLILSNIQNNAVLTADPDAVVCWMGADPGLKLDLSWKNLIGQASGESYMFEWKQPANVVIQPNERTSGIDVSMDGSRTGQSASRQQNQTLGGTASSLGQTMQQVGGVMQGTGSTLGGSSNSAGSGLGSILGGLFNQ